MMEWIVTGSVLILTVAGVRLALKGRMSLRLQYALWALVLVRLLLPVSVGQSPVSVLNALPAQASAAAPHAGTSQSPAPVQDMQEMHGAQGAPEEHTPAAMQPIQGAPGGQSAPASPAPPSFAPFDWAAALRTVWLVGAGAVGLCLAASNIAFAARLRRSRRSVAADGTRLRVYVSRAAVTPCLFGLFRPAIYLTPAVLSDEAALAHVIAHETTHFRHGDHIWSALRCVCLALHWYNPLVWLAASLSRRDSELACDESTLRRIGEGERERYGRTLIGLACPERMGSGLFCAATTMTGSKRGLRERIRLLAKRPRMAALTLAVVALTAAVAAGCTFTGALSRHSTLRLDADGLDPLGNNARYTLSLTDEIKGMELSVEVWHDGGMTDRSVLMWTGAADSLRLSAGVLEMAGSDWTGGVLTAELSLDGRSEYVTAQPSFPEGERFNSYSFGCYGEGGKPFDVEAGHEYILAAIQFGRPNEAVMNAWNCETYTREPEYLTKPAYLLVVRATFLADAPGSTGVYVSDAPSPTPADEPSAPPQSTPGASAGGEVIPSDEPALAVVSGGESTSAWLHPTYAQIWGEHGWVMADGLELNAEAVARREAEGGIAEILLGQDAHFEVRGDLSLAGGVDVYSTAFELIGRNMTLWDVAALEPGSYYCVANADVRGEYIASELQFERSGYACVFRARVESGRSAAVFYPDDIRELTGALYVTTYGSYAVSDPAALHEIELMLGSAQETGSTACPFGSPLYLTRADGVCGVVYPAEDSCAVFASGERYFDFGKGNEQLHALLGVADEPSTAREYDAQGRVTRETVYYFGVIPGDIRCYEYNAEGLLAGETYISGDGSMMRVNNYTYDASGYLIEDEQLYNGEPDFRIVYENDARGNVLRTTRMNSDGSVGVSFAYQYDAQDRCIRMDYDDGCHETYEYDEAGNRIRQSIHDPDGSLSRRYDSEYDADGRCTRMSCVLPDGSVEARWEYSYENGLRTTRYYDSTGRLGETTTERWKE